MAIKFKTIDEYHSQFPERQQELMDQLRAIINKAVPGANECISYNMPAFKKGKVLCYYAAYKNHIGFYPTSGPIAALKSELKDYAFSKGAVQFPLTRKIPAPIVRKLLAFRLKQIEG